MSRLTKAIILGLLIAIVGLTVSIVPWGLELEENVGLDILFKLRGARQAPSDVIIVSIDKISATHLNLLNDPRKWPRSLHARLTEVLAHAGAVVTVFDVIFDEAQSPADDQAFASAIRTANNVVLFESLAGETIPVTSKDR